MRKRKKKPDKRGNSNNYYQMPLLTFLYCFPDCYSFLPFGVDVTDLRYFVRVYPKKGLVQLGYSAKS